MGVHRDGVPGGLQPRHRLDEDVAAERLGHVFQQQAAEDSAAPALVVHAAGPASRGVEKREADGVVLVIFDDLGLRIGQSPSRWQCHLQKTGLDVVLEGDGLGGELLPWIADGLDGLKDGQPPELTYSGCPVRQASRRAAMTSSAVSVSPVIRRIGPDSALVLERQRAGLAGFAGLLRRLGEGRDSRSDNRDRPRAGRFDRRSATVRAQRSLRPDRPRRAPRSRTGRRRNSRLLGGATTMARVTCPPSPKVARIRGRASRPGSLRRRPRSRSARRPARVSAGYGAAPPWT